MESLETREAQVGSKMKMWLWNILLESSTEMSCVPPVSPKSVTVLREAWVTFYMNAMSFAI